jgi:hypothetical protein
MTPVNYLPRRGGRLPDRFSALISSWRFRFAYSFCLRFFRGLPPSLAHRVSVARSYFAALALPPLLPTLARYCRIAFSLFALIT